MKCHSVVQQFGFQNAAHFSTFECFFSRNIRILLFTFGGFGEFQRCSAVEIGVVRYLNQHSKPNHVESIEKGTSIDLFFIIFEEHLNFFYI